MSATLPMLHQPVSVAGNVVFGDFVEVWQFATICAGIASRKSASSILSVPMKSMRSRA